MAEGFYEGLADALTGGDAEMEELIRQELIKGEHAEVAMAEAQQQRIAEANGRIERAFVDGLGEMTMQVDLTAYMLWQLREPGCWGDKGFREAIARDNPKVRVKSRSRKTTIVNPGFKSQGMPA